MLRLSLCEGSKRGEIEDNPNRRTGLATKVLLALSLTLLLLSLSKGVVSADDGWREKAYIFFSSGCGECVRYVESSLIPALEGQGFGGRVEHHDYLTPQGRQTLVALVEEIGLSPEVRSSLYALVPTEEGTIVFLGHVPASLVEETLASSDLPSDLVVAQPVMTDHPSSYRLGNFQGEMREFAIDTPLEEALRESRSLFQVGAEPVMATITEGLAALLPSVIIAGLVDGINPCAFAVILFLIAFLYTLRRAKKEILKLGGVYIAAIYFVYLLIGLGILRAVSLSSQPHIWARIASILLIILGLINLKDYFWPHLPVHLTMPSFAHERMPDLVKKASVPATLVMGGLVGLCTFPCSGGIYVSIVTLLAAKTTFALGVGYLLLYNLMFVTPLVAIVGLAGNRLTAKAWANWERAHSRDLRLWYGLIMVAMGIIVLFWII